MKIVIITYRSKFSNPTCYKNTRVKCSIKTSIGGFQPVEVKHENVIKIAPSIGMLIAQTAKAALSFDISLYAYSIFPRTISLVFSIKVSISRRFRIKTFIGCFPSFGFRVLGRCQKLLINLTYLDVHSFPIRLASISWQKSQLTVFVPVDENLDSVSFLSASASWEAGDAKSVIQKYRHLFSNT